MSNVPLAGAADVAVPPGGPVLVARGRLDEVWRVLLMCPLVAASPGLFFGPVLLIGGGDELTAFEVFAFVTAIFVCLLPIAIAFVMAWGIWQGSVRYVVDGTHILVFRGRRLVRDVDATDYTTIQVCGRATWRNVIFAISVLGFWTVPPMVRCWTKRPEQLVGRLKELPHVMLWGAEAAQKFHDDLAEALARNGVTTEVTTDRSF